MSTKKPPARYEAGQLEKTRKNIGVLEKEEAARMMKVLGGEIGVEKPEEIDDAVPYVQKRIRHINKDVLLVTLGAGDNWRLSSEIFALNAADKESKSEKTDKTDTADTKETLQ